MNVEETKRLILRRLGELRGCSGGEDGEREVAPRRPPRRRSASAPSPWLRSRRPLVSADLEDRIRELEERLLAVERCFVEMPRGQNRRPGRQSSERAAHKDAPKDAEANKGFDYEGLPYRLTGSVQDGLMTDVLQMLASNQKSGRFSLFVGDGRERLDVFFSKGEIVHAKAGDLEGDAAFFSMMVTGHQQGHYGFLEEDDKEVKHTIEAKTQFLILDALRRIDEERHGGDGAGDGGAK